MEYEQSTEQPSLKSLLGHDATLGKEFGIINEYEGFIQRRAYDYLMVGFVTDVDQMEEQREARFEEYLGKINTDLSDYRRDVDQWNQQHTRNADPYKWQLQIDDRGRVMKDDYGRPIRRVDLPTPEVCKAAIITHPAISHEPTRDELKSVAQESIEKYFDQALNDSYNLLAGQLRDIASELPTAPYEPIEPGVRTRDELIREYQKDISRMNAIEALMIERNPPVDAADNLGLLQHEFSPEIAPTTAKIYIVRHLGKVSADLVRTA